MRSLRWLLLAAPLSWVLAWLDAPALAVFSAAGLAVVPPAAELGAATGGLAAPAGPPARGLLNAPLRHPPGLIGAVPGPPARPLDLLEASLLRAILREPP